MGYLKEDLGGVNFSPQTKNASIFFSAGALFRFAVVKSAATFARGPPDSVSVIHSVCIYVTSTCNVD